MSQPLLSCRSKGIRLLAFLKWNIRRDKGVALRCDEFEAKSRWRLYKYGRTIGLVASHGYNQIVENLSIWQTQQTRVGSDHLNWKFGGDDAAW